MKESVGVTTGVEKASGTIIAARFRRSLDFFAVPDIGERVGRSFQLILLSYLVKASLRSEIALAIQLDFIGLVGSPR